MLTQVLQRPLEVPLRDIGDEPGVGLHVEAHLGGQTLLDHELRQDEVAEQLIACIVQDKVHLLLLLGLLIVQAPPDLRRLVNENMLIGGRHILQHLAVGLLDYLRIAGHIVAVAPHVDPQQLVENLQAVLRSASVLGQGQDIIHVVGQGMFLDLGKEIVGLEEDAVLQEGLEFTVQIALGVKGAGPIEGALSIGQVADEVVPQFSIGFWG